MKKGSYKYLLQLSHGIRREIRELRRTQRMHACTESFHLHILTEKADPDAKIFPWSMPARYYMKPGRVVIYGSAVAAGQTRKGDIHTSDEVMRSVREPIYVVLFPSLNGFALLPIL